jgi:uncharacterized protein involved in exopolysaccharide biosynthesis
VTGTTAVPPGTAAPITEPGPTRAPASVPEGDISFVELLAPLRRRWRLVFGVAGALALVAGIVLVLLPPVYTGRTTFTPETPTSPSLSGNLSGLASLAGLTGLSTSLSGGSISPEFFTKLTESEEVLRSALRTPFPDPAQPAVRRPLLDLLRVKGDTPAERMDKGVRALRKRLKATADKATSIVTIEVDMRDPALAAAVANRLVELLNQFNLERRQTQSRAQREFTEGRLKVANGELREAEQALEGFLAQNRYFRESPLLLTQEQRLERTLRIKQEVFLTLTTSYEQARVAEVRDTPVLTVIDPAIPPTRRAGPHRALGVAVALLGGLLLGAGVAYVAEFRERVAPGRGVGGLARA